LTKFFRESKIFCYPVQNFSGDAGPIAPREAMFYNCATIISNHDCFNEYAIDGYNCLQFNQSSSSQILELSSLLLRLINDDALCNRISVNGRKTTNDFSISNVAKMFSNNFLSVGNE
jgi:glycosyltransferase involved in cell wall biosynthesis